MKRAFVVLLVIVVLVVGKQGYDTYMSAMYVQEKLTGSLSDIAEEVVAIPLQPAGEHRIGKAHSIRKEGGSLFLVSEDVLYHYSINGQFICRITRPEDIRVAGYLVNPLEKELIVYGNADDVFYYSYDGKPKGHRKLKSDDPKKRILSLAIHQGHILSLEENSYMDPDTQQVFLRKELVAYDTSFHKLGAYPLAVPGLGRKSYIASCINPRICIDPDTGRIYAYSASVEPQHLPLDTLSLNRYWRGNIEGGVSYLSSMAAGRFWLSSYHGSEDPEKNYTFCFDRSTCEYRQMDKGWHDNFYKTGYVEQLEAMDIYNSSYCFSKSGKEIKKAFPDHVAGNAVVFIVKMKTA